MYVYEVRGFMAGMSYRVWTVYGDNSAEAAQEAHSRGMVEVTSVEKKPF